MEAAMAGRGCADGALAGANAGHPAAFIQDFQNRHRASLSVSLSQPRFGFLLNWRPTLAKPDLNQEPLDGNGLTREAAAKRLIEALGVYVETFLAPAARHDDWISQTESPLGRQRHLDAVRQGLLPASRIGRKVLVRRRDLDAFLANQGGKPDSADRQAVALMSSLGLEVRRA
jgi:hypothetical protein